MSKRNRRPRNRSRIRKPKSTAAPRTIIFCKPYRVLSAFSDPEGRPALGDYINLPGVYAAGRLDYDSEGLLLLTSDGRLAHRVTHPKFKLSKRYLVQVENVPHPAALEQLRRGVVVKGVRTRPAGVELLASEPIIFPRSTPIRARKNIPTCWLKVTLQEGRKRQVRRMTAAVGYPTLRLVRIAIGPLHLGGLLPGYWRHLTPLELETLHDKLRLI